MRVVVPFTSLHPITRQVLDSYDLHVEYVPVDDDDDSYRLLLKRLWHERKPVVVIEHDVVPYPTCIEELHACPAMWCANSYTWNGGIGLYHMLGCTKLSAQLMEALPAVWDEPCHWSLCDQRLFFAARAQGIEPHQHRPPVVHLKGMR